MSRYRISQRLVVPVMFVATLFLVVMDGAITTVALPSIARQFHTQAAGIDSVVVVYPVCVGLIIPVSGWLGDRFGGKPVLLGAMGLFTLSSALCGLAGGIGQLVVFRGLQGLSGGLLTPVVGAMLFRTFTAEERLRASRVMTLPQQVAPSVAPMLGGFLVDSFSWRWVFYVNLPFGAAAVLFGLLFLENSREEAPGRFDVAGLLLSASAISLLMFGVCDGAQRGWSSPAIAGSLAAGAVLLAATIAVELRRAEPLLRLRLLRNPLFRGTNVVNLIGLIPFMGAMYMAPLFLQEAQGVSALESGTSTFTEAIGVLLTVQLVSRLYERTGPRPIIAGGLFCVAAVLAVMSTCDLHTSLWTFRLYMFLLGLGMGAVFMPTTVASFSTIAKSDVGQASTVSSVIRQLSMAMAPALVATLLLSTTTAPAAEPPLSSYRTVYLVLSALALLSALHALTLRRPDDAARPPRRPSLPRLHNRATSG
ncbi:DHA2 family efflux MFS transporter permease subunit [Peterkaempfera griseoplana]|uniref:DHA2 family efflux MFS transporter permease subunit n=1 Tax=Peterkaempfera griseoplana TaxID=66896 RepID=UPI0006E39A3B|nr:DHA2 family efflux MFS transporter permease subunit [Peterkaempfera griseoplana]